MSIPAYLDMAVVNVALLLVLECDIFNFEQDSEFRRLQVSCRVPPEELRVHMAEWARTASEVVMYACDELSAGRSVWRSLSV